MNLDEAAVSFENLDLFAGQVVEGFITGLHKSPFHGFSVEFAEHRIYNTGESTRHIDWKLYGRTDKLFIKRFEEETNLRCHILLDVSPSMYYPAENHRKIRFAATAAAVLAKLLKKQRDAFSLCRFGDRIYSQTDVRSSTSHYRQVLAQLLETLNSEKKAAQSRIANTLDEIAESIHRRSLVVILTDMYDADSDTTALFNALQHLRFKKHEVILFHISDRETEENFNFENRPYRFVDPETGEEMKAYPAQVRDAYLQRIQAFHKELKLKCSQFRIDLEMIDAGKDFQQVLLPFFIKRRSMH